MGTQYRQLTLVERYQIEAFSDMDFSAREMAKRLDRSNKTISDELKRYRKGAYKADVANTMAKQKRTLATKHTKRSLALEKTIQTHLYLGFSPEQIVGRQRLEEAAETVSTCTIYNWVKRLKLRHLLARKGKRYKQRKGAEAGVHLIPNRVDISERPAIVDDNVEMGHWEGDTVHGQDGYLVTLVERVSKILLTKRVKRKTKAEVTRAIKQLMRPYKHLCKTITFDNGGEFADHKKVGKALQCQIYFAKPYHSWQRGLNENTNGLLRRFFPKGAAIGSVPEKAIKEAAFWINIRPRKTLGYLSPYEFLSGKRVSLIVAI